ncbi:hypothetical protein K6W16_13740 [Burkholderia dolosa]|uniref:Uncharacterized protein n=1 Tax=Burkholderia dolosa TaxID=152500 RepID=A0A892I1M5_9BURK|nr:MULTISPECIES: hypothetical protein [Burkholderia]AKE03789.1 hypothetical protein XM57_13025 [Burkholderia cepacia]AYZ98554.1 hypothetical protein EGY28_27140 [Burkholderia dolosa]MBR8418952.1 hypothetical protein [Burkholderia dolosa]MBY4658481.1 hypothetical protein [Burkholderia dolosa]MBY4689153.1 hypothetical protein [Burkholderia dolosa]
MKRAWQITHLAAVWLLLGIAFVALARVWTIVAQSSGSQKDFWDVATTIGTCGAVAVALYVSFTDQRRRVRDEAAMARVTASGITNRLTVAIARLVALKGTIDVAVSKQIARVDLETLGYDLRTLEICTLDQVRALIPLPHFCADNIAAAQDRLHVALTFIDAEAENNRWSPASRKSAMTAASSLISDAIGMLARAAKTCGDASRAIHAGRGAQVD